MNQPINELLTLKQVQELLQVGRTFAYALVKRGELPSYRVGKLLRVRRQDVERWLQQNRYSAGTQKRLPRTQAEELAALSQTQEKVTGEQQQGGR